MNNEITEINKFVFEIMNISINNKYFVALV